MPRYSVMYATVVAAASDAIDLLQNVPGADPAIQRLQKALFKAENRYIRDLKRENAVLNIIKKTRPRRWKAIKSVFSAADELQAQWQEESSVSEP